MKYEILNANSPNAIRLQSIGWVLGTPARDVKKNDFLMWNFGEKEQIIEVVKETKLFIEVVCKSSSGYIGNRKLKKDRLVCILQ